MVLLSRYWPNIQWSGMTLQISDQPAVFHKNRATTDRSVSQDRLITAGDLERLPGYLRTVG